MLKNENTIVSSLISQEEAQVTEIDNLVETKFQGSLPAFIAAFSKKQNLSDKQYEEIMKIIESGGTK